ncbi:MAG: xanthine dehydrogenase small subunit [Hyphomicrobiaceae bacterium]
MAEQRGEEAVMGEQVSFILNGERHDIDGIRPTTTLLGYLRNEKRLTGTKEGCAEGDCGACTVAVGRLVRGEIQYRPLNACIQFLPMLHGTSIVTVEGVRGPNDCLHPCQEAIVDHHGSQCGFCTPGCVMSLYALNQTDGPVDRSRVVDALVGNLCRCTGYGPLIDAGLQAQSKPRPTWDDDRVCRDAAQLREMHTSSPDAQGSGARRFFIPGTVEDLAKVYSTHTNATLVAGATDVGLWVTKQQRDLSDLIFIGAIDEMQCVENDGETLRMGAAVTCAQAHAALADHYPDLGELIRRFGGAQIRAAATVGGNIANGSPIGDLPPALIALGASIVLRRRFDRLRIPL